MRFKKLFAIILAIVTIVATLIVPTTTSAVSENIIDTTRKASFTIYKYEMADISTATAKGTGEATDVSNVPSDAKLFSGITFTITKIAGLEDKYFQGKGTPLPTPEEAAAMPAIGTPISLTTDENGMAKFTNLSLGIYLVQETKSRNQVVKKTPDFVVTLPRPDVTSGNSSSKWIYDVYAFPKNETKYSEITIHKSDFATNSSLENAEFKLERKDEDNNWVTVKTGLTTDSDGNVTAENLTAQTFYKITETKAPSKYILDTTDNVREVYIDSQGRVCNSNKVPYNTNNNPTLYEFAKNTKPEIDKFIDKSKGENTNLVKETTFAHHSETDRNYYTIIVTTPNIDLSKLNTFKVTDQINSTLQDPRVESVKEENTKLIAKGSTGYTTSVSASNLVTVNFSTASDTVIKPNTKYYISISCFHSLTSTPILNKSELEYTSVVGTTQTEKIETEETKTITTAFELWKSDPENKGLANAVFSLYATENDAKNNTNPIPVATSETSGYATTFKTGADGFAKIIYLDFGEDVDNDSKEYWIAEVQAPTGYLMLAKPEKITVNRQSGSYDYTQCHIQNVLQSDLPKTGGYGTMFTGIGVASLLVAGALLFTKKKKSTHN